METVLDINLIINLNHNQWRLKKTIIKKNINSDLDKYKYEINSLLNKLSKKQF